MNNIDPNLIKPYMSAQALEYVEGLELEIERLKAIESEFSDWKAGKRGVEDYLELQCQYRDRLCDIDSMEKEIERLREAQSKAVTLLQYVDWVGSGAKGIIQDAIELLLPEPPKEDDHA